MQSAQRTEYNHALEHAIARANELERPLVVFFGITDSFPEANERHYHFMFEGLQEVETSLRQKGIKMVVWNKSPEFGVVELSRDATLVVTDRGYLRIQRHWRSIVAEQIETSLIQVESDVVVPVETTSQNEEYSAATLRPKLSRILRHFLQPLKENRPRISSLNLGVDGLDVESVKQALSNLDVDRTVRPVTWIHGGLREAKRHLNVFLRHRLKYYHEMKNDPSLDMLSNMSPYLHFGQISPLYIALKVLESNSPGKGAYIEELIIRRELSMNFAFFNQSYDSPEGLPKWARETLTKHEKDKREYVYTLDELEHGKTHDPYWNAAQLQMMITGKMHGYMRMYWGKKIIEWSRTLEGAYKRALFLNNKYELDGRDPNGFAGIAWCFGKHDRPWSERPIFGKVRYMSADGLKRKFHIDDYVKTVECLDSQSENQ
jgi:deoxyribodipyrimidine photo-lyase